ncbi:MAG: Cell division protein FtsA [Alphaproteobacteria bacterium ADurb.Bin438]|nr:MAG: Cell division protein FtsA [Alphaproteobacteria bacterium ADurb.Bin438]
MGGLKNKMNETLKNKFIAAIDIGTEKTCAMIAKVEPDNSFNIVGFGHRKSKGIKNGIIVNIKETAEIVRTTLSDAEKMCGEIVSGVVVNTPVSELFSSNIVDGFQINDSIEIQPHHVNKLIDTALSKAMIKGGGIIHSIPFNFFTESTKEIENPLGMPASNLGIRMNLISSHTNSLKAIDKVLLESRVLTNKKVACPFASGLGCLNNEENGIVIDIGAGKTSIGVFIDNHLFHAGFLPFGGSHITQRIANDLTISFEEAERIKTLYGCAFVSPIDKETEITIKPIGEENTLYSINVFDLNSSISPMIRNFFNEIKEYLEKERLYNIPSKRVVLTGGGSLLQGIRDIGATILEGRQLRLGSPLKIKGNVEGINSATYSNIAGLLEFAMIKKFISPYIKNEKEKGLIDRFKSFFMKN